MASTSDDIETLIRRLTQVQQQMQALHLDDEIVWHTIPLSVTFILHWSLLQKSGFLIPQYQEARQRARQSGNPFALLKISQWLALLYLGVGQLSLAYQQSIEALALIEQFDGYALLKGYFLFCLVNVLYHRNQVEEARPLLQSMLHDAQIFQQVDLQISARIYQIKVELAAGEHARAHDMLQQVQALVQSQGFSLHAERIIPVCVEYWLATGDLAQAAQWAESTSYTPETWKDNDTATVLLVARIFLALQRYPAALELLERFREQYFEQMENTENKAEFLALLVVALHQTGKREQVHTTLLRLLALCEPEKRLRVLLNMGQPMRHILTRFLNSDEDATLRSFASSVLAAFARQEQGREGGTSANKASRNASAPASSNPLTAQEQRVLRLLAAGQTYAEIAERLVVSRNTIKTQVSSIYRKLGVSRRVEALTLAQQLSLLQENITP